MMFSSVGWGLVEKLPQPRSYLQASEVTSSSSHPNVGERGAGLGQGEGLAGSLGEFLMFYCMLVPLLQLLLCLFFPSWFSTSAFSPFCFNKNL